MSGTAIERLADFAGTLTFAQLPPEVVDYTKLLILDSLSCAGGALATIRGQMAVNRASAEESHGRAHIIGCSRAVTPRAAASAHADLGNILDADDTFLNSAHFAVTNVAAALAAGEHLHAAGTTVICAVAVGFEVSARLHLALRPDPARPDQQSTTLPTIGAAVSAAVAGALGPAELAQVMAIACWLCPNAGASRLRARSQFGSFKYAPYGAMGAAAMDSVVYARERYVADVDALDEPSFARAHGGVAFEPGMLSDDLGSKWWILETSIKPYPSFRLGHGHLDAVRAVLRDEHLEPEEIDRVELLLDPRAMSLGFVREERPSIELDQIAPAHGAMNLPHSVACVMAGVPSGPEWYSDRTLHDPALKSLAARVKLGAASATSQEEYLRLRSPTTGRLGSCLSETRISTRGITHVRHVKDCLGDPWNAATRWNWDLAEEKLRSFCTQGGPDIEHLADRCRHLEDLPDPSALFTVRGGPHGG
jgi:2-methylcitrate dehydratase PrpD